MNKKIDKSQFEAWKNDPVTQKLMETFREMQSQINVALLDEITIMDSSNGRARLLGQREGIESFLTVELADVDENEESV